MSLGKSDDQTNVVLSWVKKPFAGNVGPDAPPIPGASCTHSVRNSARSGQCVRYRFTACEVCAQKIGEVRLVEVGGHFVGDEDLRAQRVKWRAGRDKAELVQELVTVAGKDQGDVLRNDVGLDQVGSPGQFVGAVAGKCVVEARVRFEIV